MTDLDMGLGLILMVLGVAGYSFAPPLYIGRSERLLECIFMYYVVLAFTLFFEGITGYLEYFCFGTFACINIYFIKVNSFVNTNDFYCVWCKYAERRLDI